MWSAAAYGIKAAVKLLIKEFLSKKTLKSKEFLVLMVNKLLTPSKIGVIIATIGIRIKQVRYCAKSYMSDITQNLISAKSELLGKAYIVCSSFTSIGAFFVLIPDMLDGSIDGYFKMKIK